MAGKMTTRTVAIISPLILLSVVQMARADLCVGTPVRVDPGLEPCEIFIDTKMIRTGTGEVGHFWTANRVQCFPNRGRLFYRGSRDGHLGEIVQVNRDESRAIQRLSTCAPEHSPYDPSTLYAAWMRDGDPNPRDSEIWFSRSLDGGKTFDQEVLLVQPAAGRRLVKSIDLRCDPRGRAYLVFGAVGENDIVENVFFMRSEDAGMTWSEIVRLNEVPANLLDDPEFASNASGELIVVWGQGGYPITLTQTGSLDGGVTWSQPGPIPTYQPPPSESSLARSVVIDERGDVSIVWGVQNTNPERDVLHVRAEHAGQGHWSSVNRISQPGLGVIDWSPTLAQSPDGWVYVAWPRRDSEGRRYWYINRSERGIHWAGETRVTQVVIVGLPYSDATAQIGTDASGHVFLIYHVHVANPRVARVYVVASENYGDSWSEPIAVDGDREWDRNYFGIVSVQEGSAALAWLEVPPIALPDPSELFTNVIRFSR